MDFTKMSSGYQNLLPRHHRCHQSTAVAVTGAPPSLSPECQHHRCHYRSAARHRYQVLTSVRSSYRLLHVIYWCRCHPRLPKLDATSNAWLLRSRTSTPRLTPPHLHLRRLSSTMDTAARSSPSPRLKLYD
jgi:hypothetical protein